MRCPTLAELPSPPPGKTGWPWIEESPQLPETMPDGRPWSRITIVTPSYNQGQFIEETIRSVLLQGYPNLEYFIFDGGSTDESVEIIRKYEPWLSYWVSERDKGQSDAINKGFARSTGEILAWLNSDDTYLPGAFKSAITNFYAFPKSAVVYGKSQLCDAFGTPIREVGRNFDFRLMLDIYNVVPQPSTFIRRHYATQTTPLDLNLHYTMDYDYWLRLALLGEFHFVDELWSTYRWHPTSKTSRWPLTTDIEIVTIYENYFKRDDLPTHVANLRPMALQRAHLACANRYFLLKQLAKSRHHTICALRANWKVIFEYSWRISLVRAVLGRTIFSQAKKLLKKRE